MPPINPSVVITGALQGWQQPTLMQISQDFFTPKGYPCAFYSLSWQSVSHQGQMETQISASAKLPQPSTHQHIRSLSWSLRANQQEDHSSAYARVEQPPFLHAKQYLGKNSSPKEWSDTGMGYAGRWWSHHPQKCSRNI